MRWPAAILAAALAAPAAAGGGFALDAEALNAASPAPGTRIDAGNVAAHAGILDAQVAAMVREGLLAIRVGETFSLPPHPAYRAATRAHAGKARLGEGPGELHGYVAGLPFPEAPQPGDPNAGEKLAWNFRYAFGPDSGEIQDFFWQYRDMRRGKLERELAFHAAQLRFMHRHVTPPAALEPNPAGIYNALYLEVQSPPDLRNTQLLIQRAEDDTERDRTWLYVATQRRVRRLASGQTTDAFLGSDLMIEDFIGYNGRIMDMRWRYEGTREVLLPFFRHPEAGLVERRPPQPDGFRFVGFHGEGQCFPDVPWQLRRAHVLVAEPIRDDHPLSKRRYYLDAQTHVIVYGNNFDRAGRLWKVGYGAYAHPDVHAAANAGTHVPVIDAATMVDLQARHCTTLQFKTTANTGDLGPNDFTVQALRARGR